ncbi:hypothetical protein THASP1DRAFT_27429 [Thamnocephalis sphaerospora]|uniref:RBR-type E3 ubiquitin transferase n=1 Tax=Thamnocephalis sphaerospora TaxID=78915 RepID=A0A4P9XWU2_9FUNG|nr:hypothetical protein THASP1DRAFT_27429 [Thamnocephalis sphaerospora]|eukprot:RKP10774.1 hypothetical protein THASP1DRAFT_27429 [Thamnocephalis sphaerospora]
MDWFVRSFDYLKWEFEEEYPTKQSECGICYSKIEASPAKAGRSTGPVEGLFLACNHGYCIVCFTQFLNGKVQAPGNCHPVQCPADGCNFTVTDSTAQKYLSASRMELWQEKKIESDPKKMVYCPNKRCSAAVSLFLPSGRRKKSPTLCQRCTTSICVECRVAFHNGYTCAEYAKIQAAKGDEDEQVLRLAGVKKWRRCPECHTLVELYYGCNHITCACKAEL